MSDAEDKTAPAPPLPITWRPRKARITTYTLAGVVLVTMLVLAVILPESWAVSDRVGIVTIGAAIAAALLFFARPRIVADEDRLTVVNVLRTRVLEWPEIIDVRMPRGEPWPTIDLANGSTLAAMGIQSNDGRHAEANLSQLLTLLHERGEASEPRLGGDE